MVKKKKPQKRDLDYHHHMMNPLAVKVKTREGRPIKIENNTDAATNGMANARVNASVLGLYDNLRVKAPMKGGSKISWETFMSETTSKLNGLIPLNSANSSVISVSGIRFVIVADSLGNGIDIAGSPKR